MSFKKLLCIVVLNTLIITGMYSITLGQNQNGNVTPDLNIDLEFGTAISEEDELPFWLHSNRWGVIERSSANGFVRMAPEAELGTVGSVRFRAGAELVGRWSDQSSAFVNEGYLQADW